MKKEDLQNILLMSGREKYLIRWACEQIRKKYVAPAAEFFDFVKIDGASEEISGITEACETLPMLSEKRVVLVTDFEESSGRGDEIAEYMKDFPQSTILLLLCDRVDEEKKNVPGSGEIRFLLRFRPSGSAAAAVICRKAFPGGRGRNSIRISAAISSSCQDITTGIPNIRWIISSTIFPRRRPSAEAGLPRRISKIR